MSYEKICLLYLWRSGKTCCKTLLILNNYSYILLYIYINADQCLGPSLFKYCYLNWVCLFPGWLEFFHEIWMLKIFLSLQFGNKRKKMCLLLHVVMKRGMKGGWSVWSGVNFINILRRYFGAKNYKADM